MNEAAWKRLLGKIRENNVVPIIGSGLQVGSDGRTSLQAQIAMHLMNESGKNVAELSLPPFRELNEAVSLLKGSAKLQDLYDNVHEGIQAVTGAKDFTVPKPIQQLSEIANFPLFVTLTADDLLARTLRLRCAVNEIIYSPYLPTSERKDLPSGWQARAGEVNVLYLFGKSRSAPMFAIHDEDVLEYSHSLIAQGRNVLNGFLSELQERNLLLVGCNFPEWLSRFFLRATNQKRLTEIYRSSWLIEQLKAEESFTCFISRYGGGTEIVSDLSPVDFVAELHRRWMNEHGLSAQEPSGMAGEEVPRGAMFFISYSRAADLPRAEALYQSLLKLGVTETEVWFDRKNVEPGNTFRRRILDGIQTCQYFLPLLSRATSERDRGFVFQEWVEATDCRKQINAREFILPTIVDKEIQLDHYVKNDSVWTWLTEMKIDYAHAPEGRPNEVFTQKLIALLRTARRKGAQS